ncbi:MAG: type II toxin-antitoxin system RelE/ParE family toxin [Sulfuritalea sp.]|jgi:toxin ParE1/3/4|nr:type II toxin-antitoxin system RelE/ParE family toxin [Sulfuritalea sp.]
MPKRLEWSIRAERDLERIEAYYAESVSPAVARRARDAINAAVMRLAVLPVLHRPGKYNTREAVMKVFPYTIVYRAAADSVRIVRVLHQAKKYFN